MSQTFSKQNSAKTSSAMSGSIHRANTVDISKFTFGDPSINKYGGKSSRVRYDGQDFYIQTPRMRLPYGMSKFEEKDKEGKDPKFSLDFSFAGYEKDENGEPHDQKIHEFFEFLNKMHNLLISTAQKNSATWLDIEDANTAVVKALVRDTIKYAKDKKTKKVTDKYPPTLKAKVGYWQGKFMVNAFDADKNPIADLQTFVVPRTEAIAILKLTGVNFAGGKVGYSFQLHQVKFYPPVSMPSYAFIDDEQDSKPVNTIHNDVESEEASTSKPKYSNMVDDSDDDDGDNDDDELDAQDSESEEEERPRTPSPPKKPVKKVITKKKTTA